MTVIPFDAPSFVPTLYGHRHCEKGVYAIYHETTCLYVGMAKDLFSRCLGHRCALRAGKHKNRNLQAAYAKADEKSLYFIVMETSEPRQGTERRLIAQLRPTCNINLVAQQPDPTPTPEDR